MSFLTDSMLAKYHASLRNARPLETYLNRPLPPITAEIFSQMPTQDVTQYAYDSFLVADDNESIYEKKKPKKKKGKKKKMNEKENKKRRVRCLDESGSSEDKGTSLIDLEE